jgi:putative ATP-dependent endonuclease of OLD family
MVWRSFYGRSPQKSTAPYLLSVAIVRLLLLRDECDGPTHMYLAKLTIKNFRAIASCDLRFSEGLNVIVGENNIGKSTVIDALRVLLPTIDQQSSILTDLDIGRANPKSPIELSYVFDGLSVDEEAVFIEALVPKGNGKYEAHFHVRLKGGKYGRRLTAQKWCGAQETQNLPTEVLDELISIYLPPLRNPTEGLKPGYFSQIARLVKCFSNATDKEALEDLAKKLDADLKEQAPISSASGAINQKIEDITGVDMSQKVTMSFTAPDFRKILGRLALWVEGMDVEQNGLGYNNVIYTAAVLSQLTHENKAAYRALLIEEPEAHLHPHLQTLLLRHLVEQAASQKLKKLGIEDAAAERDAEGALAPLPVQVIVTSHSPIFASQAPLDSVVSLHNDGMTLKCINVSELQIPDPQKRKLERFLDSTRAELFFARKIIMVEGIAEALLLPLFAKSIGVDLKDKAVSIVNVQGLNFDAFLELLVEKGIRIPCAVITDADPAKVNTEQVYPKRTEASIPSTTAAGLRTLETDLMKVFLSKKTFEYDLALNPANLPTLMKAYKKLHPKVAAKLETECEALECDNEPAGRCIADLEPCESCNFERTKLFFTSFEKSCESKGEFAQELALQIDNGEVFEPPPYILEAVRHVVGKDLVIPNPTFVFESSEL